MKTFAEKNWGDCSKAVAYCLNFVQMCYGSTDKDYTDYYKIECPVCEKAVQISDLIFPKGRFSKRDYYDLGYDFGVSENLKNDMVSFGAADDNFRPVFSIKDGSVLGYQITPKIVLPSLVKENGYQEISCCEVCGHKSYELKDDIYDLNAYKRLGYPEYIDDEALKVLNKHHMAKTAEAEDVFISLELYNQLIKKYPRLECRPVFLGSVEYDREYIRLHDTSLDVLPGMTEYTLLEHISVAGDFKILGVFKSSEIPKMIKHYSQFEGFNEVNSIFAANRKCFIDDEIQDEVAILHIWNKMDIDEEDYDDYLPIYTNIYKNEETAKSQLNKILLSNNIDIDTVYYYIGSWFINIRYWDCGFATEYYE